jgi:hypothetical protein
MTDVLVPDQALSPFSRPCSASQDFDQAKALDSQAPVVNLPPAQQERTSQPTDAQQAQPDTNAAPQGQSLMPTMQNGMQPMPMQDMQGQMQGQMQNQMVPMQGMQGQVQPVMQGQGMPQMQGMQPMQMQPMNGMQPMMMQNGMQPVMVQNNMMMQMPDPSQQWNAGYGQAPAGWIMVPMGPMMDNQQQAHGMMQQGMYQGDYGMQQGMSYTGQPMGHMHMRNGMMLDDKRNKWHRRKREDGGRRTGGDESKKVFVGGLGPGTSAKTLRSYFGQFGTIIDCAVIADGTTRRSRGFGFVEFQDEIPDGVLDVDHTIEQRRCGVRPYSYRNVQGMSFIR